jgi:spermidine synthase
LFDEDGAGLSLLKFERTSPASTVEVYVNGLGQSWLPYGNIHTALGALPVFIHPAPADVAIIGFGSGDTAFAAAGRAEVQRLLSIEILGAQRRTLERLLQVQRYPGLLAVLSDPRIDHRVGDGRAYIARSGRSFDGIEADVLRPSSAYAGNLYSREYFAMLARHLKPGGYGVTWAPTERIRATFVAVFPHVLSLGGDIYIGSNAAIPFDPIAVAARAAAVRYYYESAGVDIAGLLRPYLETTPQRFAPGDARKAADFNTDMFPRDEFALPF